MGLGPLLGFGFLISVLLVDVCMDGAGQRLVR
jgi:hypothetical protein